MYKIVQLVQCTKTFFKILGAVKFYLVIEITYNYYLYRWKSFMLIVSENVGRTIDSALRYKHYLYSKGVSQNIVWIIRIRISRSQFPDLTNIAHLM